MTANGRTIAYKPRGKYPRVLVTCTDPSCGVEFESGAWSHTNCPDCDRNLVVHRSAEPSGREPVPLAAIRRPGGAVRQQLIPSTPVRQVPAAVWQVPVLPAVSEPGDDIVDAELVDDDDETYIRLAGGQCVRAVWTAAGQLVPALWDGSAWVPAAVQLPPATSPRALPAPARKELSWLDALVVAGLPLDPLAPPGRCPIIKAGSICGKDADQPISERIFICFSDQQFLARIIKRGGKLT